MFALVNTSLPEFHNTYHLTAILDQDIFDAMNPLQQIRTFGNGFSCFARFGYVFIYRSFTVN